MPVLTGHSIPQHELVPVGGLTRESGEHSMSLSKQSERAFRAGAVSVDVHEAVHGQRCDLSGCTRDSPFIAVACGIIGFAFEITVELSFGVCSFLCYCRECHNACVSLPWQPGDAQAACPCA